MTRRAANSPKHLSILFSLNIFLTFGIPDSDCRIICVFLASLALNTDGNANASSNELVCSDWVPPNTAAIASIVVRMMLLYGSLEKMAKNVEILKQTLFIACAIPYWCKKYITISWFKL